ncbi:MAG: tetrahydromethanopterin S-methyltransferase subunit A [Methanotrichaceae archaeon]
MTADRAPKGYEEPWPPIRGDYVVGDPERSVAVVTLASSLRAEGASLIGPCKTENLGIEKIIANVISNSNIRFLLICGNESKGHLPGNTLQALHKNGIDGTGRIIGSKGAIPFIQNLSPDAIKRFQDQITIIDKIGLVDVQKIEELIREYSSCSVPYPERPFLVLKKKARRTEMDTKAEKGDLFLGSGVAVDSSTWTTLEE